MHPLHTFPSYFRRIHSNIILPSTPFELSFPFTFSNQNIVRIHPSRACYTPRPSHPLSFYHPNNIRWGVQVMKLLITPSSPAFCHFLPLRSKYSPQHGLYFSSILRTSHNERINRLYSITQLRESCPLDSPRQQLTRVVKVPHISGFMIDTSPPPPPHALRPK